jgi:hypothetical protein
MEDAAEDIRKGQPMPAAIRSRSQESETGA